MPSAQGDDVNDDILPGMSVDVVCTPHMEDSSTQTVKDSSFSWLGINQAQGQAK